MNQEQPIGSDQQGLVSARRRSAARWELKSRVALTGGFELTNTRVHQNLLLHHIGRSMARSAVLLRELCNMAGRAYRPADLLEISWRDLQWVEIQRRASPSQREELPVREEVVEDSEGVVSSVIVPTLEPAAEDAMEEESSVGSPNN